MSWLSAAWHWYAAESVSQTGAVDHPHAALVNPVVASLGAALLVGAALQQAATARRRHREQTDADRQRRITESFSKATEQLGSDKVEVRLGGIYTLERISRESPDDYWTVMETLCAFVRERARRSEPETASAETVARFYKKEKKTGSGPATDIAAVLAIVIRRDEKNRRREREQKWRLDFRGTDLSEANFSGADLSETNLRRANLSAADLSRADLSTANLSRADLSGADLSEANLRRANLRGANLGGGGPRPGQSQRRQPLRGPPPRGGPQPG